MITVWTIYLVAAVAVSGVFVALGWRSRHAWSLAATQNQPALPIDPLWGETEIDINAPEPQADVGAVIRLVLKRLAPVMTSHAVHAEIAFPSGLLVRMRIAVLADLLEELLDIAIHNAPASRLLMTATAHGDRIYVGITDDRPGADLMVRRESIRGLAERIATHGDALDVHIRPIEGTTMTLRLAAATEQDRPLSGAVSDVSDSLSRP